MDTRPLFDRSQPLTADMLASRFFSEQPGRSQLSPKQARWLSDVWLRTGQKDQCPQDGLNGWGTLLDTAMQPIGRWTLALSPLGGGFITYAIETAPPVEEELPYHPLIEGLNNPDGNYGWGDEHAPPCTECGTHTPEGTDTSASGWLCDRCFGVLFR